MARVPEELFIIQSILTRIIRAQKEFIRLFLSFFSGLNMAGTAAAAAVYYLINSPNDDYLNQFDSMEFAFTESQHLSTMASSETTPLPTMDDDDGNQTAINDLTDAFFGHVFNRLNYEYRSVHGYLSLVVCVFGIIANVLNIIVLTR